MTIGQLQVDSFIFGTPLSFIEHHVQHGNSLMAASVADFVAYKRGRGAARRPVR